jgi:hypothetical protein
MKLKRHILTAVLLTGLAAGLQSLRAEDMPMKDKNDAKMGQADAKVKPYPLDTCIVSGEKLGGDMGKPIVTVYQGQEIKFCCASCPKKFNKDPEKYIKLMNEAVAKKAAEKK